MAISGALIGKAIGAFGSKPKIPDLPQIDPNQVQQQAISGNLSALPGATQLASGVNTFNAGEAQRLFKQALEFLNPGSFGQVSNTIGSQLRGEVPADVQQQLLRSGAARALSSGTAGSGFSRNATLRDLGLTSLQIQQQGFTNLMSLAPQVTPQAFNVTSMFFSPQQRLEFAFNDRSARFQRDLLFEQMKAAPDPATAAIGREVDRFFNTVAQVGTSMAGGGGMGGMGG